MTITIELQPGWSLEPLECPLDDPPHVVGYIETHPNRETGEPCRGTLWIDGTSRCVVRGGPGIPATPIWQQTSTDPINLEPSIACRACGRHYFIHGGRIEMAEGT